MTWRNVTLALTATLLTGSAVLADKPIRNESSFGSLKGPEAAEARKQAEAWLKSVGKDDATLAKVRTIWEGDRPLLDKVAATLAAGDADAAKLLAEARDADAPAPTAVPAVLKDSKKSAFYRNNLALAYGKALTTRKVYEEALESLAVVKPDDAVDPAAFFFHKAVCEHALMLKDNATGSIDRLLVDVHDVPERYRIIAALMHWDMATWQEKDLGWLARKMDNIQRRLDLKRGGRNTQRLQKEVLVRLDEMIKEIEARQKQPPGTPGDNDGSCPPGGPQQPGPDGQGTERSTAPAKDTIPSSANGTGQVNVKRVKEIAEVWGKLPEKERAEALRELTRTLPPKDRAIVEAYFKEIQKRSSR
jgi:hypothetical protein